MKKQGITYLIIFLSTITIILFINSDKNEADSFLYKALHQKNAVSAVRIPQELYFAGERVPLENFDTRESLEKELIINTYWHSQTLLIVKRSNRYFPIIDSILTANNIPTDFKYLAVAESGLSHVVSPSQAVGFWQFLEGTARDYGLKVNDMVDERYHLEKSTESACKYLRQSFEKYGSWTMAAASYNRGRKFISNQIKLQNQNSYYDLLLGEEGERYVFRILALKMILENPEEYGFVPDSNVYEPLPYYLVEIDSTIDNFGVFAQKYHTNYKILKMLNPWLRQPYLRVYNNEVYTVKIPVNDFRAAVSYSNDTIIIDENISDTLLTYNGKP